MGILDWFRAPRKQAAEAKEEHRKTRGHLAEKLVELDHARHNLDLMVKRSLELMEPRK